MSRVGRLVWATVAALALVAGVGACADEEKESSEIVQKKAQCRELLGHVYRISPQSAPQFAGKSDGDAKKLADELVAGLPAEDIDQCVAAKPEINACIAAAADVAAVKQCIADGTKKKDGE